ncbi:MAG: AAA family ATPase [Gemmatimonadota bacterium]|nr:AAA family ATPase [Gemmatimonadota bacterium]
MIACRLLGPVEVTVDGQAAPPELLWRKNLALLVYLALSPRGARTRDHLIGLLWGDKDASAARHSLREAIRVLRQSLGDALESDSNQVRLRSNAVTLDTSDCERWAEAGEWDRAAGLVAGDFMEGFGVPDASPFEDWLAAQRATWRARAADAACRLAEVCVRRGQTIEARTHARRAVTLEPLSDQALQTLMRAEALAGDRVAALAAFARFRELVTRETDVTPSAATADLARRIEAMRGPAPPRASGGDARRLWARRTPLVGRENDLAALGALLDRVTGRRQPGVAVISGDLGMGKTRLLDEVLHRAVLAGASVASAIAVRADRDDPWSTVRGIAHDGLDAAPGVAAAPPGALAALAHEIPTWADRFPTARQTTPVGLGRAFREVVAAACHDGPVVLAVDEAQWADSDSLGALEALVRDVPAAPLLVLIAASAGVAHPLLDDVRAAIGQTVDGVALRLERLTADALRALAAWAMPDYGVEQLDRLTRRVLADSAGFPLLAVEMLHAITLGLEPSDLGTGVWPAPHRTLEETLPAELPDAVVASVRVGFRGLSASAQRTLATLSILPDRADESLIARAAGLDTDPLRDALDELEWHRWIASDARGYTFVARIVRDIVAMDMLTDGQRRRIWEATGLTPA